ncbi:hypothetical protein FOYG_17502 [Fusarium oxysporum NRRL 32931]|uniref:Uncharacterized protein n=1 Tax=Fusarium oxysporum NRRL 32931 TaxID=660029 RepID=W9HE82_FUSOX|nr:hypothetical protein FOYG_17502 [Fusarium oxysporum NRRL 32931]
MDLRLIFLVHSLAPTVLTYLDLDFVPTVWHRDGEVEIKPGLPEDFLQRPWSKSGKFGNGSTTKEGRK